MPEQRTGYRQRNVLRKHAKVEVKTLVVLIHCFGQGLGVPAAALETRLSEKTVRAYFIAFRDRLTKTAFNRWHSGWAALVTVKDEDIQEAARDAYFDTLSQCYFNRTCWRNYSAGNRRSRLCRACLLPERFTSPDKVAEALDAIDAVRAFDTHTGIGAEHGIDRATLFKRRMLHAAVIGTVARNTRKGPAGNLSIQDKGFLSFRALVETLLEDLFADPL